MRRPLFRILKDAGFPARCGLCGKLYRPAVTGLGSTCTSCFETVFAAWAGDFFCEACARAEWIAAPMCSHCGLPYASAHGVDHPCSHCAATPYSFDAARAAGRYEHALRQMVQDLKYGGLEYLARPLGQLLWTALMKYWHPDEFDWILPVPLHWRRLFKRGFNQAEILVRCWPELAARASVSFSPAKVGPRLLIRHRHTASQTGLGRRQRNANLKDAFTVREKDDVAGRSVLIVDDVFTTGATVDACSRVLKRAGAASVKVLTLARAV